jgi:cytosine/adenosine deaminase-related metal-dependent hydrolase
VFALHARFVLPVDAPPMSDAAVVIDGGRIIEVGKVDRRIETVSLGNAILMPGLVNAHTHLEFSSLNSPLGSPGTRLCDWIADVIRWRQQMDADPLHATGWRSEAIRRGLAESLRFGVTTLADIATPPVERQCYEGECDSTVFVEFIGLTRQRAEQREQIVQSHFEANRGRSSEIAWGISPHAPYTVRWESLLSLCRRSSAEQVPVAMHLAESTDEAELLRSASGPFRDLLGRLGAWESDAIPLGLTASDYLEVLAGASRSLVIHGNYLAAEQIEFLARRSDRMSVVYCPRTHEYFGHARYPLEHMLAAGVRVALGTDSRASNPDLDLLTEVRAVARNYPALDRETILNMATLQGAAALGLADDRGSLRPGKRADLIAVRLPDDSIAAPYAFLDDPACRVERVYRAGNLVFTGGSC